MDHAHDLDFPEAHLRIQQGLRDFVRYSIRRVLKSLFCLMFGIFAVFLFFSLYSYQPTDISLNTVASLTVTQNWMKQPGAYSADLLIQLWGYGGYLWVIIFAAWGGAVGQSFRVFPSIKRIFFALMAVTAASALVSMSIGVNDIPTGSGGVIGVFLTGMAQTGIWELDIAQWALSILLILVCLHLAVGSTWQMGKYFTRMLFAPLALLNALFIMLFFRKKTAYGAPDFTAPSHESSVSTRHRASSLNRAAATAALPYPETPPSRSLQSHDEPLDIHHLIDPYNDISVDGEWDDIFAPRHADDAPPNFSFMQDGDSDDAGVLASVSAPVAHPSGAENPWQDFSADNGFVSPQRHSNDEDSFDDDEHGDTPPVSLHQQDFTPPAFALLEPVESAGETISDVQIQYHGRKLEEVLQSFKIEGKIDGARSGPIVTLYEFDPVPGVKTSRIVALAEDVARAMSVDCVRIASVSGKSVIGIELPNPESSMVGLREILQSRMFQNHKGALPIVLGKDISGKEVITDLAKMPHLLIAGTTGSGKSVGVNAMILSLLYRYAPQQCRMIMIDPKMLELSVYNDIPHLLTPVVTEPKRAIVALKWAVREMERRYQMMAEQNTRNIVNYNQKSVTLETLEHLPYIVIVIDEMADLMLVAGKEIETLLQRLAQMARAAGIHLITATQRPSVDVITGTIKANFPTRISYQVTSRFDSRTILGEQGAENLLGRGDMLFMQTGGKARRVHGPFTSDQEVERVCEFLKTQSAPDYVSGLTDDSSYGGKAGHPASGSSLDDELYNQAVALVLKEQKASTSFIQRHLQIGYNRAARLIEHMEKENIISKANHAGKRDILIAAA